jgi:hypothetical protein
MMIQERNRASSLLATLYLLDIAGNGPCKALTSRLIRLAILASALSRS